jgi:hypothetical protein
VYRITVITLICSHTYNTIMSLSSRLLSHSTHFPIIQAVCELFKEISWPSLLLLLTVNIGFSYNFSNSMIIIGWCTYSYNVPVCLVLWWSSTCSPYCSLLNLMGVSPSTSSRFLLIWIHSKSGCIWVKLILLMLCHVTCKPEHEMLCLIYIFKDYDVFTQIGVVQVTWRWMMLLWVDPLHFLLMRNHRGVRYLFFWIHLERLL